MGSKAGKFKTMNYLQCLFGFWNIIAYKFSVWFANFIMYAR